MKKINKKIFEGWTGKEGEEAFNKMLIAFNEMSQEDILRTMFAYMSYEQLKKFYGYMEQDGYFEGISENRKPQPKANHVKRVNEMNSDGDYAYLDYLNMEVKLYDNIEDFAKQFDEIDTAKLYDFVDSVYDHVEGDPMPSKTDRNEIMEYIYLYASEVARYE